MDAIMTNADGGGESAVPIIALASAAASCGDSNDMKINETGAAAAADDDDDDEDDDCARECFSSSAMVETIDEKSKISRPLSSSMEEDAIPDGGATSNIPSADVQMKSGIDIDNVLQGHAHDDGVDIIGEVNSAASAIADTDSTIIIPPPPGTESSRRTPDRDRDVIVSEREHDILASIRHRRRLLSWIRACRLESQSIILGGSSVGGGNSGGRRRGFIGAMLSDYASRERSVESSGGQKQGRFVGGDMSSSSSSSLAAASEIADFRTLTEMANLPPPSFKRIRTSLTIVEKNPRDLRRGTSVGKHVSNSAESSPSNRVGVVEGMTSTTTNTIGNGSIGHSRSEYGGGGTGSVILLPPPSTSDKSSPGTNMHNHPSSDTIGKQFHKLASSAKVPNAYGTTTGDERPKKGRKRKANHGDNGDGTTVVPIGGNAQHKFTQNLSLASASTKNAPSDTMNDTHVPSMAAVNLLRRQALLMTRLDDLIRREKRVHDRRRIPPSIDADNDGDAGGVTTPMTPTASIHEWNNVENESSSITRVLKVYPHSTIDTNNQSAGVPPLPYNGRKSGAHVKASSVYGGGRHPQQLQLKPQPPPPPPRLPVRRKTHWDCLLDEMKWMATDFHEERKWKMAAGTMLSSAIRVYKPRKKSSTTSICATPTKKADAFRGAPVSTSSSRSSPKSLEFIGISGDGDIDQIYVDASSDDVECAKKVSRLMSMSILDHWDSIASSRCEEQSLGRQRFQMVKEVSSSTGDSVKIVQFVKSNGRLDTLRHPAEGNDSIQKKNSLVGCSSLPSSHRELGFGEISSRIKLSNKTVNILKEKTASELLKEKQYQMYKQSMKTGVELDDGQLHAVHFLECSWDTTINSNSTNCYVGNSAQCENGTLAAKSSFDDDTICSPISAIIRGEVGIGKTVAVCALLWRNRNNGPQLILCSPGALVRACLTFAIY